MEELPSIIGLPPSTHVSSNLIEASMPIAEFTPCKPKFQKGINLFKVSPDKDRFKKDLKNYDFECELPLKVAFTAESFPSDQFTNDYGQNFLSKMTDVVSGGLRDLSQMTGGKSATEILSQLNKSFGQSDIPMSGAISKIAGGIGKGAKELGKQGLEATGINEKQASGMMSRMLKGAKIDFPQTWKSSGYQPSYTLNVRLYNPNPGSDKSTKKYIIGPTAALLLLGLARSKGLGTFTWPFFHKIKSKGLFTLDPAVITNISITKGGEQQQIAFNQRPSVVDVKIELASLYTSMIANEKGDKKTKDRPTLKQYLDNMEKKKDVGNATKAIVGSSNPPELNTTTKNIASNSPSADKPEDKPGPRVSDADKNAINYVTV